MNVGDLVMWRGDCTLDDIGIVVSFHPMDGDPLIWWAGDNEYSHCSKIHLGGQLTILGGSDECR